MSALSELSILIVTWNGDELLKNCLDSVRRACGTEPEIVVVDNANLESTKAIVATHPNAQYIAAPENLGFAGGNNLGLPLCTRPYILLLNNDTIIHEEPFTQLIQYLKDHPKVAVVQGKMRLVRFGDVLDECGSYLTSWGEVCPRGYMHPTSTIISDGPVFHAKGACLMFKKSLITDLDGILFHSHFKSNNEDIDLCHRVWITGHEVHFVNTPIIDHLLGQTVSKIVNKTFDSRGEANRWFSQETNFSTPSLLSIVLRYRLLWLTSALRFAFGFNVEKTKQYFKVARIHGEERKLIKLSRQRIQSTRKVSDKTIFSSIGITIPPIWHYRMLRGINITHLLDVAFRPLGHSA